MDATIKKQNVLKSDLAGNTKLCFVKEIGGVMVVCTPDGKQIAGQRDMIITLPVQDVATVTVELLISGIET